MIPIARAATSRPVTSLRVVLTDSTIGGKDGEKGWGIDVEVVQVAQVFIVDNELRKQLEAEVRNQIKSSSELSDIKLQEEIEL